MKIKSKYLDCEFDVEINEKTVGDRKVQLIPHSVLTDIFYNRLPRDKGIRHEIEMTHISLAHCVAKCTIIDNESRRIIEIGESVRSTLVTNIAKSIPATMAQIRAFDRAVIRYLDLPDKNLYSNEELETAIDDNANAVSDKPDQADREKSASIKPEERKELSDAASVSDDFDLDPVIQDFEIPDNEIENEKDIPSFIKNEISEAEKAGQNGNDRKIAGATIVNFGKFMNKQMTVAQICDDPKNLEWAKWATRQTADTQAKKEQIEAIKRYIGE